MPGSTNINSGNYRPKQNYTCTEIWEPYLFKRQTTGALLHISHTGTNELPNYPINSRLYVDKQKCQQTHQCKVQNKKSSDYQPDRKQFIIIKANTDISISLISHNEMILRKQTRLGSKTPGGQSGDHGRVGQAPCLEKSEPFQGLCPSLLSALCMSFGSIR